MSNILAPTKLALAVFAIATMAAPTGAAFAEPPPQYNVVGNPFPNRTSMADVVAAAPANDAGSEGYQTSESGHAVAADEGLVLPTNGGNGIVQTANSLPRGFEHGTSSSAQAKSVQ